MFIKVKSQDNKIFIVPKTFYNDVLKNNGFILVEEKTKKEVYDAKLNGRTERQTGKEGDKGIAK